MGEITSSQSAGSSGWASFRKMTVTPADVTSEPLTLFVKSSSRSCKDMFEGEALGLKAMRICSEGSGDDNGYDYGDDVLRIPQVYHYGDYPTGGGSFLIMEYLNLGGRGDQRALGRAMARMHLTPATAAAGNPDNRYGFAVDNTIGGTPQPNDWSEGSTTRDWIAFFATKRIGHQLDLAGDGYCDDLWRKIEPRLGALFEGVEVRPSLLHGDLWSGNIGTADGKPTIYDPAVYWGHHEAEWGMSWCASFGAAFWEGYRELIPEDTGFRERKALYDAYHQLNHYNLFGGGYLGSAQGCLEQLKKTLDKMGA